MRRNGESSSTISKKKLLSFDERRKILNHISIFGTSKSSITLKYDAADYLHAEFSTKLMPLSVLMKSINLITEIYVQFDKDNGERVSYQLLIWPATKILHGIILHQKNPKILNVIIGDLIPLICNTVMSKIQIPSPEFEMFTCLISSFCLRNSAARHKIRTTSFPSTLIDLLGKRTLSSNDFRNTGTLLSIMEEDDIEFDNVVTDQEMLFRVFEDLYNPSNDPMVLKTIFLMFTFYFSRKTPERLEKLIQNKQILSNIINFLPSPLLSEDVRLACLRSLLYILTIENPKLSGIYLENGFIEKFGAAWNYISHHDQIWYLGSFMEFSYEIKFEFIKDGKLLSDVIIGCYGEEYKDVEDSLSCIFRLLSTLPEPLRTEFALSGAHDAIQHNIDRLPTINSIDGYSTDTINNIMIRYMEDNDKDC